METISLLRIAPDARPPSPEQYFPGQSDYGEEPISEATMADGLASILHPNAPILKPSLNGTDLYANHLIGEFVVRALKSPHSHILDHDYFVLKRTKTNTLEGPIGSYTDKTRALELAKRFTVREQTITPPGEPQVIYEAYTFWGSPVRPDPMI